MKRDKSFLKSRIFLNLIIAFILFAMTITSTFAWIQLRHDGLISFEAGSGAEITLYYATFQRDTTKPDPGLGESEPGYYQWNQGIGLKDTGHFGNKYTTEQTLQMGAIENLLYRVESNVTWFALKIKADGSRSFSNLRLSLINSNANPVTKESASGPFNLYKLIEDPAGNRVEEIIDTTPAGTDANGNKVTGKTVLDNITNKHIENLIVMDSMIITEDEPTTFLKGSKAFSAAPGGNPNPQNPDGGGTPGGGGNPPGGGGNPPGGGGNPPAYVVPMPDDDTLSVEDTQKYNPKKITCKNPLDTTIDESTLTYSGKYTGNAKYYYVYIRVIPILDRYGDMAVDIAYFMPCILTYNMLFEISTDSKLASSSSVTQ